MTITGRSHAAHLEQVEAPGAMLTTRAAKALAVLRITTGGKPRFATDIKGRLTHLSIRTRAASVMLPAGPAGWVEFPDLGNRVSVPARDKVLRLDVTRGKP